MRSFLNARRLLVVAVVMPLFVACGSESTSKPSAQRPMRPTLPKPAPAAQPAPKPSATPDAKATLDESVPFGDEWQALEPQWKEAQTFTGEYPDDPSLPVVLELSETKLVTTAFGVAILNGDREQVDAYLESGADITAPVWSKSDAKGMDFPERVFPAAMAVSAVAMGKAEAEFLTYLLERGADANATTTMYGTDKQGRIQSMSLSILFYAATCDDPSPLEALLEHGVDDVNRGSESAKGVMSPLYMAVVRNFDKSVKLLLAHGADPNVAAASKDPGSRSRTPLAMAQECLERRKEPAEREKTEAIIKLLREHGAADGQGSE